MTSHATPAAAPRASGRVLAVASGKGGVGKSTVAGNLAIALRQLGYTVGLLDCDIYGPSQQMMMGIDEKPFLDQNEKIVPIERFGVRVMSLGFLMEVDTPVIWRGPMIYKAIEQFLGDVAWGDLDWLVVDSPPGTGDEPLSVCQLIGELDGLDVSVEGLHMESDPFYYL